MHTISKKIYIIAGEASGDLHGANLMKALKAEDPSVQFRFWGGDKMLQQDTHIVKHIRDLAFMGFVEVLSNLKTIIRNIAFCKKDIDVFQPDALVLIDYPGFNLRIAEWAKAKGITVVYYISPQVWAWKQSRVHKIKRFVDKMYVILPFEKAFYKQFDFDVAYFGHPLLDAIEEYKNNAPSRHAFLTKHGLSDKPILAILPGSRKQEISVKLPIMLEALKDFTNYQLIVAGAPSLDPSFYLPYATENVHTIFGETYAILSSAEAAVVTSGTATLETALLGIPEVVCYKGSAISYRIAKRLIKIKYISLVNLIMDQLVVKELIQDDCSPENIRQEVLKITRGGAGREAMLKSYEVMKQKLGDEGVSKKVAHSLLKTI